MRLSGLGALVVVAVVTACGQARAQIQAHPQPSQIQNHAQDDDDRRGRARQRPWDRACRYPLPEQGGFTPQEKWAWNERLCLGLAADMQLATGRNDGAGCQPRQAVAPPSPPVVGASNTPAPAPAQRWPETRRLSSHFLSTILLHEPWRGAAPVSYVAIYCARISGLINWNSETILPALYMLDSIFDTNVQFYGSRFKSFVSFAGTTFLADFRADSAIFENRLFIRDGADVRGDIRLAGVQIGDNLELSGSTFRKAFIAERLTVGANMFVTAVDKPEQAGGPLKAMFEGRFSMPRATIGGSLTLTSAIFKDDVSLAGVTVASDIVMTGTEFSKTVDARGARISGNLILSSAKATQDVMLQGIDVGGDLWMRGVTFDKHVSLVGARITGTIYAGGKSAFRGQLQFTRARLGGNVEFHQSTLADLDMQGARVDGTLFLRQATFDGPVSLILLQVGQSADLTNSDFKGEVDFTQAKVQSDLRLSVLDGSHVRWHEKAALTLRNASIGALQSNMRAWHYHPLREGCGTMEPSIGDVRCLVPTDLAGFEYQRLGGLGAARGLTMSDVPGAHLVGWLAADPHHHVRANPQPYQQLAGVLRAAGMPEKAEEVVIAGRDQRKRVACSRAWNYVKRFGSSDKASAWEAGKDPPPPRSASFTEWVTSDVADCLGSEILRVTVGYGYENIRIVFWLIAFTLLGFIVLLLSDPRVLRERGMPDIPSQFWYSVDMALPIIQLQEKHKHIVLPHRAMAWFNVQKIAGYVLGSLLVASLAGLAGA
jgi:uncharacterized protein YjbI with pentapeptide repeats